MKHGDRAVRMRKFSDNNYYGYEEREQDESRLSALRMLAFAIFLILGARLYWMQVINHETYAKLAQQNRLRKLPVKAPRGRILDRNGVVLVDNRSSYSIVVSHEDVKVVEKELELFATQLGLDRTHLTKRFEDAKSEPKYLPRHRRSSCRPSVSTTRVCSPARTVTVDDCPA